MSEVFRNQETKLDTRIDLAVKFKDFAPDDFIEDPFKYFESYGVNIKSGEIEYDDAGNITEDPTSTKDLPQWHDKDGLPFGVVGKKINIEKSQVAETENPFHELEIMQIAQEFKLPTAEPIGSVSQGGEHLMLMKKVEGIRWNNSGLQELLENGFTQEDVENIVAEANEKMISLAEVYESIGIHRTWKHKDMIFNVDVPNRRLLDVIPIDWERTKIDREALEQARKALE